MTRALSLLMLCLALTACGKRDLYMIKKDGKVISPKSTEVRNGPEPLVYQLIFATTADGCGDTRRSNLLEPLPRANYEKGVKEAFEKASLYTLKKGAETMAAVSAKSSISGGYCDGEDLHVDVTFPAAESWEGELELLFAGLNHDGQKAAADSVKFTVKKADPAP